MTEVTPAARPPAGTPVPPAIRQFADGRPTRLIWENRLGGLTALVEDQAGDVVVKWQPNNRESSLAAEAKRLTWLHGRHPVPELVEHRVLDGAALLVTKALPALSAVDRAWRLRGVEATRAIAQGLRRLHALDAADCPFDWTVETRIESALVRGKRIPPQLRTPPPVDRMVVCHGDACAPTLSWRAKGASPRRWMSARSGWAIAGPTLRWRRCRWVGTSRQGWSRSSGRPTAWFLTMNGSVTTAPCGTSPVRWPPRPLSLRLSDSHDCPDTRQPLCTKLHGPSVASECGESGRSGIWQTVNAACPVVSGVLQGCSSFLGHRPQSRTHPVQIAGSSDLSVG